VSVADFYKVYGYACLYTSFKRLPITNLTVSFIESRYPKKLLGHLRDERGYTVAQTSPGIYTVSGDVLPIQVIDSRRLPAEENLWLKSLSGELSPPEVQRISEEIARQGKAVRIAAYLDVIARANVETMKEAVQMKRKSSLTLEQMFEDVGWIAKWEARGEIKGEERKAYAIAQNMVNMGLPLETVVSATQLKPEQVQTMYQGSS